MSVLTKSISPTYVWQGTLRLIFDVAGAVGQFVLRPFRHNAGTTANQGRSPRSTLVGGVNGKPRVLEARRLRLERRQMRNLLI